MATRTQQVERAGRNEQIVALVIEGLTYEAIGRQFSITPQRVHQIWKRELEKRPVPRIDEHRRKELALIDHAISALFQTIINPEHERNKVDALRVLATWSEARRRLLGLDAPQRKEISVLTEDVVDSALRKAAEDHAAYSRQLEEAELAELGEQS